MTESNIFAPGRGSWGDSKNKHMSIGRDHTHIQHMQLLMQYLYFLTEQ